MQLLLKRLMGRPVHQGPLCWTPASTTPSSWSSRLKRGSGEDVVGGAQGNRVNGFCHQCTDRRQPNHCSSHLRPHSSTTCLLASRWGVMAAGDVYKMSAEETQKFKGSASTVSMSHTRCCLTCTVVLAESYCMTLWHQHDYCALSPISNVPPYPCMPACTPTGCQQDARGPGLGAGPVAVTAGPAPSGGPGGGARRMDILPRPARQVRRCTPQIGIASNS